MFQLYLRELLALLPGGSFSTNGKVDASGYFDGIWLQIGI